MRKSVVAFLGLVAVMAAVPITTASAGLSGPKSTIAVFGDSPYAGPCTTAPPYTCPVSAQFAATDAFVGLINSDPDVGRVLHIGDIHSGKEYCTQDFDQKIFDKWTRFDDPLVYTPGDNEWSDCHKTGEGGGLFYDSPANTQPVDYANGNPVANLALVRSIFFPQPGVTLGNHKQIVLSQKYLYDRRYPTDANYVENVIWVQSDVLFVTINVPGGSNNDQDVWYGAATASQAQIDERTQRTGADTRWLDVAFFLAKLGRVKGVVIGTQADMWDPEKFVSPASTHQEGYEPIVQSVANHTADFGKPVLMFNGDSHVYRSDNPLDPTASCVTESGTCTSVAFMHPGYNVSNFHRVVVHGSTPKMEWLKLTVDPSTNAPQGSTSFGPFAWSRQITALPN